MSTSVVPRPPARQEDGLGEDLASLACNAAIELDNLILGQSYTVSFVRRLANRLTNELPEMADLSSVKHMVDPSTVVVMGHVIREFSGTPQPREVLQLTRAAAEIAQRLQSVPEDPETIRTKQAELEQLRSFCLILSKLAAASRGTTMENRPTHPSRKQG